MQTDRVRPVKLAVNKDCAKDFDWGNSLHRCSFVQSSDGKWYPEVSRTGNRTAIVGKEVSEKTVKQACKQYGFVIIDWK